MKNNIIIGAGGFIGKYLSDALYQEDSQLSLFGIDICSENYPKANIYDQLIKDFSILDQYITEDTTIYYLVNTISPTLDDHDLILNDVGLFIKFLSWASAHPNLHIIYTSSGGTIYKQNIASPINEEQPTVPISFYGMAKLTSENYLKLFSEKYGFSYTIVRISNPYGKGQPFIRNQGLIPNTLNNIREGNKITIYGDGSMVRDYIYITDLISALTKIQHSPGTKNETLNLGAGFGVSVLEVINTIEEALGVDAQKEYVPQHSGHVKSNILDISKACKLLGWEPTVSFKDGIKALTNTEN